MKNEEIDWCQRAIDNYLNSNLVSHTKKRVHMAKNTFIEAMRLAYSNGANIAAQQIKNAVEATHREISIHNRGRRKGK